MKLLLEVVFLCDQNLRNCKCQTEAKQDSLTVYNIAN